MIYETATWSGPKHWLKTTSQNNFLQIFQLTSLQGWQSNRQKPPTTSRRGLWRWLEIIGNRCQRLATGGSGSKRGHYSQFGLQHLISELADRFLKCSLGKCIEIWGVDTLCGIVLPSASWQVVSRQLDNFLVSSGPNKTTCFLTQRGVRFGEAPDGSSCFHQAAHPLFFYWEVDPSKKATADGSGAVNLRLRFVGEPSQGETVRLRRGLILNESSMLIYYS